MANQIVLRSQITNKYSLPKFNFDTIVFYACIIDILFLPYIWFFTTNYSLIILSLWVLKKYKSVAYGKEFKLFLLFTILMLLSTIISFIIFPAQIDETQVWVENIKRFLQYITCFLYYFFFSYYFNHYYVSIKKPLLFFVFFGVILAVIYNMNMSLFTNIKAIWFNKDAFSQIYLESKDYMMRYNFIWTDPNNPAYAFVAVVTFLICNEKSNILMTVILIFSLIFLLISAMSSGAVLSFAIVCLLITMLILTKSLITPSKIFKKVRLRHIIIISMAIVLLFILYSQFLSFLQSDVALESIERMQTNTGETRFEIWQSILKSENLLKYVLFGTGATVIVDGQVRATHSGHLYLIIGYGFIAYFIFMYIVFRKRKQTTWLSYVFIVPLFIGFTINTIIGEQKFLILIFILITAASSTLNPLKSAPQSWFGKKQDKCITGQAASS
jgi:hypothetical protein